MAEVELKPMESQTRNEALTAETGDNLDTENTVEGVENQAYNHAEDTQEPTGPPPLTYVDFVPRLLETAASGADAPRYSEFR